MNGKMYAAKYVIEESRAFSKITRLCFRVLLDLVQYNFRPRTFYTIITQQAMSVFCLVIVNSILRRIIEIGPQCTNSRSFSSPVHDCYGNSNERGWQRIHSCYVIDYSTLPFFQQQTPPSSSHMYCSPSAIQQ